MGGRVIGRIPAPATKRDDDAPRQGDALAWAVLSPAGRVLKGSIRKHAPDAALAVARSHEAWQEMLAEGFRTSRVAVRVIESLPDPVPARPGQSDRDP